MRYELTDCEWAAIKAMLPNKLAIKHRRRVATRYDKLAVNSLAFIQLASVRVAGR